eukprot:jgi/Astpho2/6316/Aster-08149
MCGNIFSSKPKRESHYRADEQETWHSGQAMAHGGEAKARELRDGDSDKMHYARVPGSQDGAGNHTLNPQQGERPDPLNRRSPLPTAKAGSWDAPRSRASADQAAAAPLSPTAARQAQLPRHSSGSERAPPPSTGSGRGREAPNAFQDAGLPGGSWGGTTDTSSSEHRGSSAWSGAAHLQSPEDQQDNKTHKPNWGSGDAAAPPASVHPPSSLKQGDAGGTGVAPVPALAQPSSPRQQGPRAVPASAFGQPPSPRASRSSLDSASTSISLTHLAGASSKGSSQLSFAQLAGVLSKGSSEGQASLSAATSVTLQPRGSPATPLGSVAEVATPVSPFAFSPTGTGVGGGGSTGGSGGRRGWPQATPAGVTLPALKSSSSEFFQRSSGHSQPGALLAPSPQAALPVSVPALRGSGLPTRGGNLAPRGSGGTPSSTSRGSDDVLSTRGSWEDNVARAISGMMDGSPLNDWEIPAEEIVICKRDNGEQWRLGSGAYGTVFKAQRDGVQEVAVKIFHNVADARQQKGIMREVAILRSCKSPNIVQFYGASASQESVMLVTEFMENGDLGQAMQRDRKGVLSWYKRGHRILLDIARGVHALHKSRPPILHLDLKSSNVLLGRDGTAKIADVGFANVLSNTHLTLQGAVGTFAYAGRAQLLSLSSLHEQPMSCCLLQHSAQHVGVCTQAVSSQLPNPCETLCAAPEMLLGEHCDPRADIYSFGVTMHEVLTGEPPRRGQLRDIKVPFECPEIVADLFDRCTATKPSGRPPIKATLLAAAEEPPPPGLEDMLVARHDNNDF